MARVLHLLSQRPLLTGSGVTLDALVRHAAAAGWEQHVVVGTPAAEPTPAVGGLPPEHIHPVVFDRPPLDFPVPGMSDVMPYRSSRFSALDEARLETYRQVWRRHLEQVVAAVAPTVIHSHHVWLMSALVKDVAPDLPVAVQCHATGLRQLELCPHLAPSVVAGVGRCDAFLTLHQGHAEALTTRLGVAPERVRVIGAGYRDELFHQRGRAARPQALLYIGKYSAAKGLPQLLEAVEELHRRRPAVRLHVAGSGAGDEAAALEARMRTMAMVELHGQLPQDRLADLLRRVEVAVLPSFYEGVPLVLVEAVACGCRVVSTALPGVVGELAPHLGPTVELVEPPPMAGIDVPRREALPAFVADLVRALERSLDAGPPSPPPGLARFTWRAVFERVQAVWSRGLTPDPI